MYSDWIISQASDFKCQVFQIFYNLFMIAEAEENSYEEYKKYLEDSLGIFSIPPPPKPMNPYMRYYFERNCEEKTNGNINMF